MNTTLGSNVVQFSGLNLRMISSSLNRCLRYEHYDLVMRELCSNPTLPYADSLARTHLLARTLTVSIWNCRCVKVLPLNLSAPVFYYYFYFGGAKAAFSLWWDHWWDMSRLMSQIELSWCSKASPSTWWSHKRPMSVMWHLWLPILFRAPTWHAHMSFGHHLAMQWRNESNSRLVRTIVHRPISLGGRRVRTTKKCKNV